MKIHLDTDLGGDIDDLCALALLLKWPGVEITGITTVDEVDGKRAGYTRHALALAGRAHIPVAAGADAACGRFRYAPSLPREETYWPEPVGPAATPVSAAMALLKDSIEAGARIVAIGPYTNLVLMEKVYPGTLAKADLYLMGGHVKPAPPGFPQWDNTVDWNVQYDVASARYLFDHCSATIIPIEVTGQTALRRAYLPALRAAGPLGQLLAHQAEAFAREEEYEQVYGSACEGLPDDIINFLHDPLACAIALGWPGVTSERISIRTDVRDGWLFEEQDEAGQPMTLVTAVEGTRFNEFWLQVVTA
jgi:purine nucleosidase